MADEKARSNRFVRIINSPLFVTLLVSVIIGFCVFYYNTYTQCVADARKLHEEYIALETELSARENEIVSQILKAKSLSELRKSIDQRKHNSVRYKDMSIAELQTQYLIRSQFVDETGIDRSAENKFKSSDQYQRFGSVSLGYVGDNLTENDFDGLQAFAIQFGLIQFQKLITGIRSVTEIDCIPGNIFLIMLGERPVTIQRYDAGSFVEVERLRQRSRSEHNVLPPRTPPTPFPATTFRPPVANPGSLSTSDDAAGPL